MLLYFYNGIFLLEIFMEQLNNDLLPCLQAVGPWWTDEDRRLLFCHLLSIFHFDASYLSSLPASCRNLSDGETRLSVSDIEMEYRLFQNTHTNCKINCSRIRKISFSFGKFNHRLCFLCPYSTTHKNSNRADEARFLYFIMNHSSTSIETYLSTNDSELSTYFSSYFPLHINNILVEAYPLELLVKKFYGILPGYFLEEPYQSRQLLINKLYQDIKRKVTQLHVISYIKHLYPDYLDLVAKSLVNVVKSIEYENYNTRPSNEILIRRLVKLLAEPTKIKIKPTTEYLCAIMEPLNPDLFQSKVLFSSDNLLEIDKRYEAPNNVYEFYNAVDSKISHDSNTIDNDIINSDIEAALSAATTLPLPNTDEIELSDSCSCSLYDQFDTDTSLFRNFYLLQDIENICILENMNQNELESIFFAMISDTKFLCIEPVLYEDRYCFLICNDSKDFMLYPLATLGNRLLRKISNLSVSLYTSNIYNTGRLLYSNDIFYINFHDVGIAYSISAGDSSKGIKCFSKTNFPTVMYEYPSLYESYLKKCDHDHMELIYLYETYNKLISNDGKNLPFKNIDSLYSMPDSLNIIYKYDNNATPTINGIFLHINAYMNTHMLSNSLLVHLYMKVCIELDRQYPFYRNQFYILKLSNQGILLYLTGTKRKLQMVRLFLSACARRVFSEYSTNESPISFEEKSHVYELNTIL